MKKPLLKAVFVTVFCTIFTLGGCVYLRLYQVKEQLAQFDTYFKLEESGQKLMIIAKVPLLSSADINELARYRPTQICSDGKSKTFKYVLKKVSRDSNVLADPDFNIVAEFHFENDLLKAVSVDRQYLAIVPKPVLVLALKSLGGAQVNLDKHSASGEIKTESFSNEKLELPDIEEIVHALGTPYDVSKARYEYRYVVDSPDVSQKNPFYHHIAIFDFDPNTGMVTKTTGKIYGMNVVMNYSSSSKPANTDPNNR